jgi:general stress protein 26
VLDAPPEYGFSQRAEERIAWASVLDRLERSRIYWLATGRPDGRPHVAPLWGIWLDNVLYFEGGSTTRWARNLAQNPNASINLESGIDAVILEGHGAAVPLAPSLRDRLIAAWAAKYGQYGPDAQSEEIFLFVPRTARAWSESLEDGTRWTFAS